MPLTNGAPDIYNDDIVEILEVRRKRTARENSHEPQQSRPPPRELLARHTATSHKQQRHHSRPKTLLLPKPINTGTSEAEGEGEDPTTTTTTATESSPLPPANDDPVMAPNDPPRQPIPLPPLRRLLPAPAAGPTNNNNNNHHDQNNNNNTTALEQPEPAEPENILRPHYDPRWPHCAGFVAWWDNRTGRGLVVDLRYNLEHRVELRDIKGSNYGALVPGSMVEYEFDAGGGKAGGRLSNFWVVSGCEFVLYKDAWNDEFKYQYMQREKEEYFRRNYIL